MRLIKLIWLDIVFRVLFWISLESVTPKKRPPCLKYDKDETSDYLYPATWHNPYVTWWPYAHKAPAVGSNTTCHLHVSSQKQGYTTSCLHSFFSDWANLIVMERLHDVILIGLAFNPIYLWSVKKHLSSHKQHCKWITFKCTECIPNQTRKTIIVECSVTH